MIIGTSEDGIVRQCECCNTVYKGTHCPHCALVAKNSHKRPKKTKKTYAQKQIKNTLKLSEEQEKFLKEQEKYNNK